MTTASPPMDMGLTDAGPTDAGLTDVDLTDAGLTNSGLAPAGKGRILLIACGALAREILALKSANGWDHLDLTCLPAKLHNTPD